jgi:hypothetical protein
MLPTAAEKVRSDTNVGLRIGCRNVARLPPIKVVRDSFRCGPREQSGRWSEEGRRDNTKTTRLCLTTGLDLGYAYITNKIRVDSQEHDFLSILSRAMKLYFTCWGP